MTIYFRREEKAGWVGGRDIPLEFPQTSLSPANASKPKRPLGSETRIQGAQWEVAMGPLGRARARTLLFQNRKCRDRVLKCVANVFLIP